MRICRFDSDRLGIILDGLVHDVTPIQEQIRASMPYAMKGDAVVKALPDYRDRLLVEAKKVAGAPPANGKLIAPVARPSKARHCRPGGRTRHLFAHSLAADSGMWSEQVPAFLAAQMS